MKIQGGGPNNPIDLQKVKNQKEISKNEAAASKAASGDQVSAKLSQTLQSITEQIQNSGLSIGEIHSNVNEDRAMALLGSFDRIGEGKQPRLPDAEILNMADKLSEFLSGNPAEASQAFNVPDRSRVEDLIGSV